MLTGLVKHVRGAIFVIVCAAGPFCSPASCLAQNEAAPDPSTPVLRTGTRLVIEDVIVTNAKGDPVHGLAKSAFHVFDRDQPQTIKSFEEGPPALTDAEAPPPLPPGTFSNSSYLYSSSMVSDVFLIDTDAIPVESQMFLLQQLRKSIDALPSGVQASVFCQASGRLVQVRGLTTQHEDLKSGVAQCIPRLPTPVGDSFVSGIQQLLRVAATLQPLSGRKSILWFSGPFPLVPITNNGQARVSSSANYAARTEALNQLQNILAEARLSVFPIDPRGVLLVTAPFWGTGLEEEYAYEQQLAEATGGTSSHLNDLDQQISRAVSLGRDAYGLSYSPAGYKMDNTWHTVRVTVDGPYRLSYRRGYLATWSGSSSENFRKLLSLGKKNMQTNLPASAVGKPIVFTVQLASPAGSDGTAAPLAHNDDHRIDVAVRIPVTQLGFRHDGTRWQSSAMVATYAYDDLGKLTGGEQQQVDSNLSEGQWQTAQTSQVSTHQTFVVPRSTEYVLFVVSDRASQRQGTLLIPAQALRPNL